MCVIDYNRQNGDYNQNQPREQRPLPTEPPYTAFMGNLDYDRKENAIAESLDGLHISEIRIARDKVSGKSRGHGYVEFQDQESLKEVLRLDGHNWEGRILRVDVANARRKSSLTYNDTYRGPRQTNNVSDLQMMPEQGRNVNRPEEFKQLTEEEEKQRKRLVFKPRSKPKELIGKQQTQDAEANKPKKDSFGGAKPRDEFAYQRRMSQQKMNKTEETEASEKPETNSK